MSDFMEEVVFETWPMESEARIFPWKDYAQKHTGSMVEVERGERETYSYLTVLLFCPQN